MATATKDDEWVDWKECRACGCTALDACDTGCYWVEEDLCSNCADEADTAVEAMRSTGKLAQS